MGILSRVKLSVSDYLKLHKMRRRDPATAGEVNSPVPLAPPIGWYKQPSMFDQVRDMVRSEHLRLYAASQGDENFEEANDFEVEDDIFPASQYEDAADFEPLEDLQARRQAEYEREYLAKREARRRKKEAREAAAEEAAENGSRPPEPRPSPATGAGDGGRSQAPGERSEPSR